MRHGYDSKSVTILGCKNDAGTSIAIPATIEGSPITSISSHEFMGCTQMQSITIPASVRSLYDEDSYGGPLDDRSAYPEDFTIYGKPDSVAERYAEEHKIRFVVE